MTGGTATTAAPRPGWSDLAGLMFTFFALGVTVNVLVLERVGSEPKTIVAALVINSATSELAYLAVRDAGGTVLASLVAGWIVASRFGLLAVSLGSRMGAGRAHRAAAASQAFDPNVALAIQQRQPHDVTRVFWTVTAAMLVGWYVGTFTGVFLGNVIGDTKRLGLDTVFPAALLAIIGPLLRRRPGAIAALLGGGLCLVMIPWAPAGVPIIVSLVGAFVALRVPEPGGGGRVSWTVIVLLSVGVLTQRLVGMFAGGAMLARVPALARLASLIPAAVVAAVIVQLTVAQGKSIVIDERLAGMAVAGLLVWRRAPFVVVIVAAAATTALLRLA